MARVVCQSGRSASVGEWVGELAGPEVGPLMIGEGPGVDGTVEVGGKDTMMLGVGMQADDGWKVFGEEAGIGLVERLKDEVADVGEDCVVVIK